MLMRFRWVDPLIVGMTGSLPRLCNADQWWHHCYDRQDRVAWGHMDQGINSSPFVQNGSHFTDNIFRCIFVNEKFCILVKILLKFVPKGPIDNNPALFHIMAWRQIGDKPLSEPMLTRSTDMYAALGGDELRMDWLQKQHLIYSC